jgi:hypothetical protein
MPLLSPPAERVEPGTRASEPSRADRAGPIEPGRHRAGRRCYHASSSEPAPRRPTQAPLSNRVVAEFAYERVCSRWRIISTRSPASTPRGSSAPLPASARIALPAGGRPRPECLVAHHRRLPGGRLRTQLHMLFNQSRLRSATAQTRLPWKLL